MSQKDRYDCALKQVLLDDLSQGYDSTHVDSLISDALALLRARGHILRYHYGSLGVQEPFTIWYQLAGRLSAMVKVGEVVRTERGYYGLPSAGKKTLRMVPTEFVIALDAA